MPLQHLAEPLLPASDDVESGTSPATIVGLCGLVERVTLAAHSWAGTLLTVISAFSGTYLLIKVFWREKGVEEFVCGVDQPLVFILSLLLFNSIRELRLRLTFEASAKQMEAQNERLAAENFKLKETTEELNGNLEMLNMTIGIIGTTGAEWFDQLRDLTKTLTLQQDRAALLLRGQVRMWLLTNVDFNRDGMLDANELKLLKAAHPEFDVSEFEERLASSADLIGISIQDIEPRLMTVFDTPSRSPFRQPRQIGSPAAPLLLGSASPAGPSNC